MSQAKQDQSQKTVCVNKKATHDYFIEKRFEAGLVLVGSEVKSCRLGKVQLVDSYAAIERGELYLYKSHIAEYKQGGTFFNHTPVRKRKLLMHKREIANLSAAIEKKGYTLVPLKVYLSKGRVKLELGLAKGKSKGDKRDTLKNKDVQRDMNRASRREKDKS